MKKFLLIALMCLTATAANATRAGFRVYNRSNEAVARIHVSPPSANTYGTSDLLGSETLRPGYSIWVDPGLVADSQNQCLLDVIAIGVNGSKWQKRFDVCEQSEWTLLGGNAPKTIQ